MYLVLLHHKSLLNLQALLPELMSVFASDTFKIDGSEDKGYQLQIHGTGDEREPRKFAESYLKNLEDATDKKKPTK